MTFSVAVSPITFGATATVRQGHYNLCIVNSFVLARQSLLRLMRRSI